MSLPLCQASAAGAVQPMVPCVVSGAGGATLASALRARAAAHQVLGQATQGGLALGQVAVKVAPSQCPAWVASDNPECAVLVTTIDGYAAAVYVPVSGSAAQGLVEAELSQRYARQPSLTTVDGGTQKTWATLPLRVTFAPPELGGAEEAGDVGPGFIHFETRTYQSLVRPAPGAGAPVDGPR